MFLKRIKPEFRSMFYGATLMIIADSLDSQSEKSEKDRFATSIQDQKNYLIRLNNLSLPPFYKILEAEKYILQEPIKNNLHISTPFNRNVKYIYDLENFYYMDYENYNFNKLSDLFLNIHIFIN
jgi:hypothetical protein